MLAGNWPYITAAAHPDELLLARLQDVDLTKSLLLQVNLTVMYAVQWHPMSACQCWFPSMRLASMFQSATVIHDCLPDACMYCV